MDKRKRKKKEYKYICRTKVCVTPCTLTFRDDDCDMPVLCPFRGEAKWRRING